MQTRILRISLEMALLLAGYMAGTHTSTSIHAQMMGKTIPTSYGKVVAGDSSSLWFEDSNGTLRQITILAGNTVYTVSRQK